MNATEDPDVFAREGRTYNGGDKAAPKPRFHLEAFADITIGDGPEWLVQDIVPAAGFTVIYGEAGCGKSFLASDLGLERDEVMPSRIGDSRRGANQLFALRAPVILARVTEHSLSAATSAEDLYVSVSAVALQCDVAYPYIRGERL